MNNTPITKEWLFKQAEELVNLELESLESAGAIEYVVGDGFNSLVEYCANEAHEECLNNGIKYQEDYSIWESEDLMNLVQSNLISMYGI